MKVISRLDYAYAVGRVRALEKDLITKGVFLEAAREKTLDSSLKVIFDEGRFLTEKLEVHDSGQLDGFLDYEEQDLKKTMAELLLEEALLEVFHGLETPGAVLGSPSVKHYSFIAGYLRHKVDLVNMKVFIRMRYAGCEPGPFRKVRLPGGWLDDGFFLDHYELPFSDVGERLYASPYQETWQRGIEVLESENSFVGLEREMEDFLMNHLRQARHVVFGPEPVWAYGVARIKELRQVRLIGIGKINQVPAEILRERITQTYV